jgi:hypothetical protein
MDIERSWLRSSLTCSALKEQSDFLVLRRLRVKNSFLDDAGRMGLGLFLLKLANRYF